MIKINLLPAYLRIPEGPGPRKTKEYNEVNHSKTGGVCCAVFAVFSDQKNASSVGEVTFNRDNAALRDHAEQQWLDNPKNVNELKKKMARAEFQHLEIEISNHPPCTRPKGAVDVVDGQPRPCCAFRMKEIRELMRRERPADGAEKGIFIFVMKNKVVIQRYAVTSDGRLSPKPPD
jgi:hypothetical protein